MNVEKILNNDLGIFMARSDEAKTSALCQIISEYKAKYKGNVNVFGIKQELVELLKISSFSSLIELEQITNSIVIIDELKLLFDFDNRKLRKHIINVLRIVNHNGNKILLCGLPSDFPKFICAKAKFFMYKSLMLSDMINGSMAKEILLQYRGEGLGWNCFLIPKSHILCYDGREFYVEEFQYNPEFDTKKDNIDLFRKKRS